MPFKPQKPCAQPGCPALTRERYCGAHKRADMNRYNHHQREPETAKRYDGCWKKIRAAFLAAHPLCEMCEADGRLTPATIVHHKRKLSEGGTNDSDNLQSLCAECHSRLHAGRGDYF